MCRSAYREEHTEEIAARNAAYRKEHVEEIAVRHAAYRKAHAERIAVRDAAYKKAHAEEIAAYRKAHAENNAARTAAYQKEHPEKVRVWDARHRARKLSNGRNDFIPDDLLTLLDVQNGRCAYCVGDLSLFAREDVPTRTQVHVEHVVPLEKGGENNLGNTVLAHDGCNLSKHSATWIPAIGHLAPKANAAAP